MKVVIAMDSFKGSISSMQAGLAAKAGIERVCHADITVKPLADGGEGTTQALVDGLGGSYISIQVTGPTGQPVTATYGILPDGITAVMEMAQAAGITLLPEGKPAPWDATTYGVGELILDAVQRGCREFIIGIGGSATSDGGVGMLQALGYTFVDTDGREIGRGIRELDRIDRIGREHVHSALRECRFHIACDVRNPLCGERGAVYVYGPQKGVKEQEKAVLDAKMRHYANQTAVYTGRDFRDCEGAGAAGGLGFAFLSYLEQVELRPGVEVVLEAIGLQQELQDADIVITGEGQLDGQTAMGKAPAGVAAMAKQYGALVLAFAGGVAEDAGACNQAGIDAFFPIVRGITSLEQAMEPEMAECNMMLAVEQVFRLVCNATNRCRENR
ncbi:MAG: glycerate kinase [Butyricicoccus sp.]